jgi:hypothetical protein
MPVMCRALGQGAAVQGMHPVVFEENECVGAVKVSAASAETCLFTLNKATSKFGSGRSQGSSRLCKLPCTLAAFGGGDWMQRGHCLRIIETHKMIKVNLPNAHGRDVDGPTNSEQ